MSKVSKKSNKFKNIPKVVDFIKIEHEMLKFWEQDKTFDKLRKKNQGNKTWSFMDGPITANNPMGVHHAWGRTLKDVFQPQPLPKVLDSQIHFDISYHNL